ncbi:MAG: ABC transporter permease [Sphaerobacteraceae bacterium]|nr:MAG: ABC transporter permease [Sphaerobacteraceae bacterium]
MLQFTLRRFIRGLLTLWVVVTLVFFGLRLSGDPVFLMLGDEASPEAITALRSQLGLDEPLPVQYLRYFQTVAQGDFGNSLRERRPVTEIVAERLPATAELAAAAIMISIVFGIPMGIFAALRRNTAIDRGLMAVAFFGQSAPGFFIGIMLILVFSMQLQILPSSGRGTWQHLLMPAIALSTYGVASLARLTRSATLEVLSKDYVRTARAKGLKESVVQMRHVLRNAAIPVITVLGLQIGLAISGSIVIETVFAWPGMGRLIIGAVSNRDYPVIQMAVLLIAVSVVTINFIIDILYGVIDPRIRYR